MEKKENQFITINVLLLIFFGLLSLGTLGFVFLKDMSPWNAFYQTAIVLITHFYHQINEDFFTQILILVLLLGSLVIVAYIVKFSAEYLFEGTFKENRRRRYMKKTIESYSDHFVICGFGRVGKQIAEELSDEKIDFVIIDRDAKEHAEAMRKGFPVILGDPTEEESLLKAGILKARTLIASAGNDIDNLYIVLSAKSLNPDIYIVSRCAREESISKLKRAGADRVTMPEQIGGYHMATMALRPAVVDFLDIIVDGKHDELQVEELLISPDSSFINKPLASYLYQQDKNINVLAINRSDGTTRINPKGEEILASGDKLILMGDRKDLEKETSKFVRK